MRTSELPQPPAPILFNEEEQVFLKELAAEIKDILDCAERQMATKVQGLDQEEYLAVWSLLPAKYRTAIKRAGKC